MHGCQCTALSPQLLLQVEWAVQAPGAVTPEETSVERGAENGGAAL